MNIESELVNQKKDLWQVSCACGWAVVVPGESVDRQMDAHYRKHGVGANGKKAAA